MIWRVYDTLQDGPAGLVELPDQAGGMRPAVTSDALIGSICCTPKQDALYIGRLAVRPDWRRRGVASALVDAAKDEGKRRGATRITLGARIALPGNVALFHRHGFAIVRETCHSGFTTPTSYDMELAFA